jgi:beta-1,4-N-acetylglucosaminyltransferase
MIFVTVGMHNQGFERLVRTADELSTRVEEQVIIQHGATQHAPQFAHSFDFADEAEIEKWLSQARVVVSHGGAGSILSALRADKPLVIVPRLRRFEEHIDDHQLELAEALAQQGKAVVVTVLSVEALWQAIDRAVQLSDKEPTAQSLQTTLRAWLDRQSIRPAPRRWRRRWRIS